MIGTTSECLFGGFLTILQYTSVLSSTFLVFPVHVYLSSKLFRCHQGFPTASLEASVASLWMCWVFGCRDWCFPVYPIPRALTQPVVKGCASLDLNLVNSSFSAYLQPTEWVRPSTAEVYLRIYCNSNKFKAYSIPRAPSTFYEGVRGGFRGSKYLLRRYLEPYGFVI